MTSLVTVNIRYTPPGMTEADSLHLEFQAPPGARVELHLSPPAVVQEDAGPPLGGGWREAARKIVSEAGSDVWLSTSVVRGHLAAAGIKIGRPALSEELGAMAGRGDIARRGAGPRTEYGAPDPKIRHGECSASAGPERPAPTGAQPAGGRSGGGAR